VSTETIGGGLNAVELEQALSRGTWTRYVPSEEDIAAFRAERAAERIADRERIMSSRGLRFLHWLLQTDLWKEHRAAR
jgi:hypothetical protein